MKKQTFILEIYDTQNQNWQGTIEWIQGHRRRSFRSVLELLELLDSARCKEVGTEEKSSLTERRNGDI